MSVHILPLSLLLFLNLCGSLTRISLSNNMSCFVLHSIRLKRKVLKIGYISSDHLSLLCGEFYLVTSLSHCGVTWEACARIISQLHDCFSVDRTRLYTAPTKYINLFPSLQKTITGSRQSKYTTTLLWTFRELTVFLYSDSPHLSGFLNYYLVLQHGE